MSKKKKSNKNSNYELNSSNFLWLNLKFLRFLLKILLKFGLRVPVSPGLLASGYGSVLQQKKEYREDNLRLICSINVSSFRRITHLLLLRHFTARVEEGMTKATMLSKRTTMMTTWTLFPKKRRKRTRICSRRNCRR